MNYCKPCVPREARSWTGVPRTRILEEAFLVTANSLMCMVLKSATDGCPDIHAVHSNTFYSSDSQFSTSAVSYNCVLLEQGQCYLPLL